VARQVLSPRTLLTSRHRVGELWGLTGEKESPHIALDSHHFGVFA